MCESRLFAGFRGRPVTDEAAVVFSGRPGIRDPSRMHARAEMKENAAIVNTLFSLSRCLYADSRRIYRGRFAAGCRRFCGPRRAPQPPSPAPPHPPKKTAAICARIWGGVQDGGGDGAAGTGVGGRSSRKRRVRKGAHPLQVITKRAAPAVSPVGSNIIPTVPPRPERSGEPGTRIVRHGLYLWLWSPALPAVGRGGTFVCIGEAKRPGRHGGFFGLLRRRVR